MKFRVDYEGQHTSDSDAMFACLNRAMHNGVPILVNSKESTARWEKLYGKVVYQGAWNYGKPLHGPFEGPPMPEGAPTTKAVNEDAAHFLIRMVRQYPHQVTIYAGGPLMNLALAQMIDPEFASLTKELIVMDGSIHPMTDDPEFATTPRRSA